MTDHVEKDPSRGLSADPPSGLSSDGAPAASADLSHARLVPSLDGSQIPDAKLSVHEQIRAYYGDILDGSDDLKTNAACCSQSAPPRYVIDVMPLIADEIIERFYGCGSPIPPALESCTVVDLGCGVGRDVYAISKLVGPSGTVIGVDMTPSQLRVAEKYRDEQAKRFGFDASNVEFKLGYIEDLAALGIEDESVDLVVSNCVINLTPFKKQVFEEIHRVLKPGGELLFSDVFCDRRLPDEVRNDPVLRGECLGGALYQEDFRRMLRDVGFGDYLVVSEDEIRIADLAMETKVGFSGFVSQTVRVIKTDGLEDRHENYGQTAVYKGTIPEMPRYFDLTEDIRLIKGRKTAISGNMAKMLAASRYGAHFDISEAREHRGAFDRRSAQDALDAARGKLRVDAAYLDEALARCGQPSFADRVSAPEVLTAPEGLSTLQVNITYRCNLQCRHCYLECSPRRTEMMSQEVMEKVLDAYDAGGFATLDITGGSPELHPDFSWFLAEAALRVGSRGGKLIVRTNLTLLEKPQYRHLLDELAASGAQVSASLPYYDAAATDAQRGDGVFEAAMRVIKELNARGYGVAGVSGAPGGEAPHLQLDLAYNVSGPFLPPPQDLLEDLYRAELAHAEGVAFDNLFAFNNWPLGRFAQNLLAAGLFDDYANLLVENFNALAVQRLMCRDQVNVDVDGRLYDCEVNHVLGMPIELAGRNGGVRDATVDDLLAGPLPKRAIRTHPACYSCSAGSGSSCSGSLVRDALSAQA
ncbi:radical SAM/Cys-rich domain protein [Eggerthellaceae bacterium zg-893]|nr:radical SAM/Cys-rich domain protein [Eggerthellaceae bacterium zg-893]